MKSSAELKTLAKRKMAPKLSPLVVAVVIYGAILVGLSIIIAIVYTSNLISQGAFESEEALMNYMMGQMEVSKGVTDSLISYGVELIIGSLLATLTVGIMYLCLKCARNEEFNSTDMFKVYKMNPDRIIIIYLIGYVVKFIFTIPTMLIGIFFPSHGELTIMSAIGFLLDVIGLMAQIAVTVLLAQANFIFIDNPDQNSLLTIKQSIDYMKKNFFSFLFLMMSFIPWYLVIFATFGIAAMWIVPYKYTTYALYYLNLRGELGGSVDIAI